MLCKLSVWGLKPSKPRTPCNNTLKQRKQSFTFIFNLWPQEHIRTTGPTFIVFSVILLWCKKKKKKSLANVKLHTFLLVPSCLINFSTNDIARSLQRAASSLILTSVRPVILSSHGNAKRHDIQLCCHVSPQSWLDLNVVNTASPLSSDIALAVLLKKLKKLIKHSSRSVVQQAI